MAALLDRFREGGRALVARWRVPDWLARAAAPLEPSARPVHWAALVITLIASLWFLLAATWEIDKPVAGGHWAAVAARGIIAENMDQWGILAPVREYSLTKPKPGSYYANHPWGTFWLTGLFYQVFGRHDFICRLPAVLMAASCPALLYGIGRRLWSPSAGALAAAGYAVLPISLGFANFNGFEGAVIFGTLLASWGTLRFVDGWQRRWMLVSLLGVLFCCHTDWVAYVFVGCLLGGMMLTHLLLPSRWYAPGVETRRFAQWWALSVCLAAASLLLYVALLKKSGHLAGLMQQAKMRSAGSDTPLAKVLEARRYWIELSFTPLAILVGKLTLPVLLLRWVIGRRAMDIIPLAIFTTAFTHYVFFKQGADIHIYWSQIFAPYFALALGALIWTLEGLTRRIVRRLREDSTLVVPAISLGLGLLVPLAILPDGIEALSYSRNSGGRFDEKGRIIQQDVDKMAALRWLEPQLDEQVEVLLHRSFKPDWAQLWSIHRDTRPSSSMPKSATRKKHRYMMFDTRYLRGAEMLALAKSFSITAVGPFWLVDRGGKLPLVGHVLTEEKAGWLSRYFRHGVDPNYAVKADALHTWELRHHLGQTPGPLGGGPPATLGHLRIAHNLALSKKDVAGARKLRDQLLQELDGPRVRYSDGSVLLGKRLLTDGPVTRLELYFEAGDKATTELQYTVRSKVTRRKALSMVMADERERVVGLPLALPPSLWKRGYIYLMSSEIRRRPGHERFYGYYYTRTSGKVPVPVEGPVSVPLLQLPLPQSP